MSSFPAERDSQVEASVNFSVACLGWPALVKSNTSACAARAAKLVTVGGLLQIVGNLKMS
jgi:hypothetical protein